jgi:hypothetical protein
VQAGVQRVRGPENDQLAFDQAVGRKAEENVSVRESSVQTSRAGGRRHCHTEAGRMSTPCDSSAGSRSSSYRRRLDFGSNAQAGAGIINVSCVGAVRPSTRELPYAIAKARLHTVAAAVSQRSRTFPRRRRGRVISVMAASG